MYHTSYRELDVIALYTDNYSERLYLREIATLSGIPLRTVQRILDALTKARILRSETEGKNRYFYLNMENANTTYMILQAEIQKTMKFLEKYPFFKAFVKELKTNAPLVVFGSYARGEASDESDADILVVSNRDIPLPSHLIPCRVHALKMTRKQLLKARNETIIKKIKESHIILSNHSFFVDFMVKT
ncbi:MAG: hypothetical protein GXO64_01785 [Candidatus Micrarchaeota archaeon]|nr:hypothetical protein [Candidatus Micrarchaeota archaeon]